MSRQFDQQADGPNSHPATETARFDALIAEVRALRERADRLSVRAEAILADNLATRAELARRRSG